MSGLVAGEDGAEGGMHNTDVPYLSGKQTGLFSPNSSCRRHKSCRAAVVEVVHLRLGQGSNLLRRGRHRASPLIELIAAHLRRSVLMKTTRLDARPVPKVKHGEGAAGDVHSPATPSRHGPSVSAARCGTMSMPFEARRNASMSLMSAWVCRCTPPGGVKPLNSYFRRGRGSQGHRSALSHDYR